ncbi:MAG TPA: GAP family protein [Promicromonospora sp.]|nr:GAP family protein [Promicromonospora sp.]
MDLLSAELTGTTLVGALVVLALIDSTSFGTLLIPVWLLMSPGRVRVGRMLLYLGSIAGFYALVGLAVLLGADALGETLERLSSTRAFLVGQLVVGAGLLAWSFKIEPIGGRRKTDDAPSAGAVRLGRWRERVLGSETGSGRALALLAVGAGLVEVATMLPYLAALGLVGTQGPGWPTSALWVAGYCVVMVAPALVLTAARVVAARLVERPLGRLDAWLTRNAASTTAWVVGIVGFLVARDAVGRLWG